MSAKCITVDGHDSRAQIVASVTVKDIVSELMKRELLPDTQDPAYWGWKKAITTVSSTEEGAECIRGRLVDMVNELATLVEANWRLDEKPHLLCDLVWLMWPNMNLGEMKRVLEPSYEYITTEKQYKAARSTFIKNHRPALVRAMCERIHVERGNGQNANKQ